MTITEKQLLEIEKAMERGHSQRSACDLIGVPRSTWRDAVDRDERIRARFLRAKARCLDHWLKRVETCKGSADWKAASIMLGALDPERFREHPPPGAATGIAIQFVTLPPGGDGQTRPRVRVVSASGEQLPPGKGGLPVTSRQTGIGLPEVVVEPEERERGT